TTPHPEKYAGAPGQSPQAPGQTLFRPHADAVPGACACAVRSYQCLRAGPSWLTSCALIQAVDPFPEARQGFVPGHINVHRGDGDIAFTHRMKIRTPACISAPTRRPCPVPL